MEVISGYFLSCGLLAFGILWCFLMLLKGKRGNFTAVLCLAVGWDERAAAAIGSASTFLLRSRAVVLKQGHQSDKYSSSFVQNGILNLRFCFPVQSCWVQTSMFRTVPPISNRTPAVYQVIFISQRSPVI